MRHAVLAIILILTIPAFCQGSIGPAPSLELTKLETAGWDDYRLQLEHQLQADTAGSGSLDFALDAGEWKINSRSLDEINGGIPYAGKPAARDMASMMSFVWAEIFVGVDIVAEVKDFARQIRRKGRTVKDRQNKRRDSRNRWKFVVSCRVDEHSEVAALFENRGRFFGEGNLALEINTLDPMSEEIGLKMAYSDGDLDIRADRMTLTETAAAKLMLKF
jgi:hypothetical protein